MRIPAFDDIVFEKLNKEYGAYVLRKKYNRVVILSIATACLFGSSLVLIPFLTVPSETTKLITISGYVTMDNMLAPPGQPGTPVPPSLKAPVPSKPPAKLKTPEAKYIAPAVVDSVPPEEKVVLSSSDSIPGGVSEKGDIYGTADGEGSRSAGGYGGGGGGSLPVADVMPKFKGGDINKFREWVRKKTRYPEIAILNGIRGQVYITFVVEEDGSVAEGKVVKGVDPLIDEEALRAVMSSPKWTPGKLRGVSVRVSYIIMVNFEL